jgi:hypothetical protein
MYIVVFNLIFSSLFSHQKLQMGYIEKTNDATLKLIMAGSPGSIGNLQSPIFLLLVLTLDNSCSIGAQVFAEQIR